MAGNDLGDITTAVINSSVASSAAGAFGVEIVNIVGGMLVMFMTIFSWVFAFLVGLMVLMIMNFLIIAAVTVSMGWASSVGKVFETAAHVGWWVFMNITYIQAWFIVCGSLHTRPWQTAVITVSSLCIIYTTPWFLVLLFNSGARTVEFVYGHITGRRTAKTTSSTGKPQATNTNASKSSQPAPEEVELMKCEDGVSID